MGILDGYEMLNVPEKPFISLSKYGVTFSRLALSLLSDAAYVHIFLDRKNLKFAVQPCEQDEAAMELVRSEQKKSQRFVRWGNRDLLRTLCSLSGSDISKGTVRINGEYHPEEDVMIFDLAAPVQNAK